MDLSKLTNKTVKDAIEALQAGDKRWYSFFVENPEMTDDGNSINFKNFFSNALGAEKFLTIDKVETTATMCTEILKPEAGERLRSFSNFTKMPMASFTNWISDKLRTDAS